MTRASVRELRLALVCHMVTSTTEWCNYWGIGNLRATQAEAAASSDWNKKRTHLKETGTLPIPFDPPSLISYTTQSATNAMQQIVKSDFCSIASTNQPAQTSFL